MRPIFLIDGESFNVFTASIRRNFKIQEGSNSGTAISGRDRFDVIGTRYNYTLEIDASTMERAEYDRMYELLSAPVESHTITAPYGQGTITFEAHVESGQDTVSAMAEDEDIIDWGGLSITFSAIEPQRRP